jgi:hypothetical protein
MIPVALESWHPYLSVNIWQEKKKRMEIAAFKDKSHILLVLTFDHSDLNILS